MTLMIVAARNLDGGNKFLNIQNTPRIQIKMHMYVCSNKW
jgi:hypothetical protein